MKNIFLCGFMGCGKSTVGQALAPMLGMSFIDMDKFIEETAGEPVSDIFKCHGEAHFRLLEAQAAKTLSGMNDIVAATGGGAVLSRQNEAAFKSSGYIVFIDVPLNIIAQRLEADNTRPLLQKTDKAAAMRSLFLERIPIYRAAADYYVSNSDNRSELLIAREIADKFIRLL